MTMLFDVIQNVTSSSDTISGLGGVLMLVVLGGIAMGVFYVLLSAASSLDRYKRFKKVWRRIGFVFNYAAYGLLTVAVVGVPIYTGYMVFNIARDNVEATTEIVKDIGMILGVFIGLVMVGFVTKNRIWKKLFKYHRLVKQEQKEIEKQNEIWDEIPKDINI